MSNLTSPIIEVEDSLEAVNDWFCREKLSDGLPIVPPTAERVERMLEWTNRDPQEVIGSIPPKWAPASVEKIAINAVMAGCLPEYLPVVIAAVEAMCEPRFNLYGVQATTGYVGPALMVNGPLRKTLDINCDCRCVRTGLSVERDDRPRHSLDPHHRRWWFSRRYRPFDLWLAWQIHHVLRRESGKKPLGAVSCRNGLQARREHRSPCAVSMAFCPCTQREIGVSRRCRHWPR